MSLILPLDHPASPALRGEGIDLLSPQSIALRPLELLLVNLMPDKPGTDRQFLRLLGGSRRPVRLSFALPDGYCCRHTPAAYLETFYRPWAELKRRRFDGLIVTGAPLEHLDFAEVRYWAGLQEIFDWAEESAGVTLFVCWAALAALHRNHGVPRRLAPAKHAGVFRQCVLEPGDPLVQGLGSAFPTPVSRHFALSAADLPAAVRPIAGCDEAGLCLLADPARRAWHMLNHLEYDADTLLNEFLRDLATGDRARLPRHYLPGDSLARQPLAVWRPAARRFFANWLQQAAERGEGYA